MEPLAEALQTVARMKKARMIATRLWKLGVGYEQSKVIKEHEWQAVAVAARQKRIVGPVTRKIVSILLNEREKAAARKAEKETRARLLVDRARELTRKAELGLPQTRFKVADRVKVVRGSNILNLGEIGTVLSISTDTGLGPVLHVLFDKDKARNEAALTLDAKAWDSYLEIVGEDQ